MDRGERDVLARVRAACAAVAAGAYGPSRVHVEEERVVDYARSLPRDVLAAPSLDPAHHHLGDEDATIAFVVTLDAINFGSGWFPLLRKRSGRSGYFTIAGALKDRFDEYGPWSAADLLALTTADCAAVFGQDPDGPVADLMSLFARALSDLGRFLLDRHGGRFAGPVEAAEGSAAALVDELRVMPLFADEHDYRGERIPFYKRAQITAADLSLAFDRRGPGEFRDLDRLTIFADNLVPHVLRVDGVLRYDPGLAARIDAGELLDAGSEEEIEIRAGAVHAVELAVEALRGDGSGVSAMELDYLLWNRGQQPAYKAVPRHRCRTVYY